MPATIAVDLGASIPARDVDLIEIDRGSQDEFDRTGTGRCVVSAMIVTGRSNALAGVEPGGEGRVSLRNAATGGLHEIFTGVIEDIDFVPDGKGVKTEVQVTLLDGNAKINGVELVSDDSLNPRFGYTVPRGYFGQIFYEDAAEVQLRINKVLDECGWSPALRAIYTGNVSLQEMLYSPRTSALQIIHDCCDAEFPGIGQFFFDRFGVARFKGRLSRFNPDDPQYEVSRFLAGASTAGRAQIRGISHNRGRSRVINAYQAIPRNCPEHRLPDVTFVDEASINEHGLRSDSADGLVMDMGYLGNPNRTRWEECALISEYYVTNYAQPRDRITSMNFKSLRGDDYRAAATWNLLCNADISYIVEPSLSAPGAEYNSPYFIEGVNYQIRPGSDTFAMVDLDLNLSPVAFWESDPF